MCVCVCVCVYPYVHIGIYRYICLHIYKKALSEFTGFARVLNGALRVNPNPLVRLLVYMYICMYIYMHTYVNI